MSTPSRLGVCRDTPLRASSTPVRYPRTPHESPARRAWHTMHHTASPAVPADGRSSQYGLLVTDGASLS
jgi:hypothetical protein